MRRLSPAVSKWLCASSILAFVGVIAFTRLSDETLPPPGPPLHGSDLPKYFMPSVAFLHRSLWSGEFPLWNPHQMAGTPFVALHSPGATYPLLLPLTLLPTGTALTLHVLIHLSLAGLFTAAFLRQLGVGVSGAVAAGIAYAGSAPLISAIHNTAYLSTYVWLPAAFLGVEFIVRRPGSHSIALLSLILAMGVLAGHSQGFLYLGQIAVLYAFFRMSQREARSRLPRILCALALSGCLAMGLAAFQLIATAVHAAGATRNLEGLSLAQAGSRALSLNELALSVLGLAPGRGGLPLLALPLAVLAFAHRTLRPVVVFFVVLELGLVDFMRGERGHLFPLYYALPAGNLFRFPYRIAFVYYFLASALVAIGVDWLVSRPFLEGRGRVAIAIVLPVLVSVSVYVQNPLRYRFVPLTEPSPTESEIALAEFTKGIGYDRIFVQDRFGRKIGPKFGTELLAYMVPDYDPMLPGTYRRFFAVPGRIWHGGLSVLPVGGPNRRLSPAQDPRLLDLISVRYYAGGVSRGERAGSTLIAKATHSKFVGDHGVAVYERASALPRTYVVHEVVEAADDADALTAVRRHRFDPRKQVIAIAPVPALEPEAPGAREWARIVSYHPNSVEVEARCATRCMVVLTDLYDTDWKVSVDGRSAATTRVNYLLRGVIVEPGARVIRYRYLPRALLIGIPISALSLSLIAGSVVVAGRRRRYCDRRASSASATTRRDNGNAGTVNNAAPRLQ